MIINLNPKITTYRNEMLAKLREEELAAFNDIKPFPEVLLLMAEVLSDPTSTAMKQLIEWRKKAAALSDKHSNAKKSINGAKTVAAIRKVAED